MSFDRNLLEIVVCPACKGTLVYDQTLQELHCNFDRLAYRIQEGIPVLLIAQARSLKEEGQDKT